MPAKRKSDYVDKSIDHFYEPIPMMVMKDDSEAYFIKMNQIFDVPFSLPIVGPSKVSGKTNIIGNLLLRDEFYRGIFQPENIYVICPTIDVDGKWKTIIDQLGIPPSNIYRSYNEKQLNALCTKIEDDYHMAMASNDLPPYVLVIFDDCAHSGALKKHQIGFISKLYCNLRHFNVSNIITAQKYTQVSTIARSNCTGLMIFACGGSDPDLLYNDVGFAMTRSKFIQAYEREAFQPHSYLIYNKTNPPDCRFMDSSWCPVYMPYRVK
jgi:hypothetical protein